MRGLRDPGRIAGLWYLLLVAIGPLRLIYIPQKLFVRGDATATAANLVAHEQLFRLGIVTNLVGQIVLVLLTLAFYRLFRAVEPHLAALVVILGGVMPALLGFATVVADAGALLVAKGAPFLSVFDPRQRDAIVLLFLRLNDQQITASEILWGAWLFPLAILVYRSGFLPRFLGIWLALNGAAWVAMSLAGFLRPEASDRLYLIFQPALLGEIALVLWLLVRGAAPPARESPAGAAAAN